METKKSFSGIIKLFEKKEYSILVVFLIIISIVSVVIVFGDKTNKYILFNDKGRLESTTLNNTSTGSSNITKENIDIYSNYISDISSTRNGYQSFKLIGNCNTSIDKIEVEYMAGTKKNSYILQSYKKGDGSFVTNLKINLGNLIEGSNKYVIKGYIGDKVVVKKDYTLDFKKTGCEIIYKTTIDTSDETNIEAQKYKNKYRVYSIFMNGNCKNQILDNTSNNQLKLSDGTTILLQDMFGFAGGFGRFTKDLKSEKLSNNNVESNITSLISWDASDTEDSTGNTPPKDARLINYEVLGYYGSLKFLINSGLTKDNIDKKYEQLKQLIVNTTELPSENLVFNSKTVNLKSSIFKGNTITLVDSNGLQKNISIKKQLFENYSTIEEAKRDGLSLSKIEGNKLYIDFYDGGSSFGISYSVIIDINNGNILSLKKENIGE